MHLLVRTINATRQSGSLEASTAIRYQTRAGISYLSYCARGGTRFYICTYARRGRQCRQTEIDLDAFTTREKERKSEKESERPRWFVPGESNPGKYSRYYSTPSSTIIATDIIDIIS